MLTNLGVDITALRVQIVLVIRGLHLYDCLVHLLVSISDLECFLLLCHLFYLFYLTIK